MPRIRQWWGYKTQLEKILMVLLAFALLVVVILATVMKQNMQKVRPPETCNSIHCLTESLKIMRISDSATNPCHDFYQFVCGNFAENSNEMENLPFEAVQNEQLMQACGEKIEYNDHKIVKLAKNLFKGCLAGGLDGKSKGVLRKVADLVGGWPILEGENWNETDFDWKTASYKLRKLGYFDEIFVDVDMNREENSTGFVLEVLVADVFDYQYGIIGVDKIGVMGDVAEFFGVEKTRQVLDELGEAHNFQQSLQALVYYKQNKEDAHFKYTISHYQKLCNSINWLEFINKMLGPTIQITGDEIAVFPPPEIFSKWLEVIENAPKRIQANYLMWKVLEKILPHLSQVKIGLQKRQTREEFCLDLLKDKNLLEPMRILLHRKFVSLDKRKVLGALVEKFKAELVESLNDSKSFNVSDRVKAVRRMEELKIVVEPAENYDDGVLDRLAVETIDPENGTFLDYLSQATRNKRTQKLSKLHSNNTQIWDSVTKFPYYRPEDKTIYAGNLATHKTFFNEKRPDYVNYAILGAILGGAFREALESCGETAITLGKCLTDGTFSDEESRLLAFIVTGQKISYEAYQNSVRKTGKELGLSYVQRTPAQIFWISSISTYCKPNTFHGFPSKFQQDVKKYVLKAVKNNPRFVKDFNCPAISAKCDD